MRPARHDDLPLRHPGRPGARTSKSSPPFTSGGSTASSWRRAPTRSGARSPICRRRGCPASWSTARSIPRSIRSASTIARRCANWSTMSPGSGIAASATSAATPGSRRRSSASSATATLSRGCGLAVDERYLVTGNASTASAAEATHALLKLPEPPTAIVTGNNMATIGAMRAVRARGLARSRRHFHRRLRRFRMGGLLRAAADAGRPALRGDRPKSGVSPDGADRRAGRRAAHRPARRGARLRDSCARPR